MANKIRITAGQVSQTAILNDSKCAQSIWDSLPLHAKASTWGDEIYFGIPVECGPESPRTTVDLGDLGYWLEGSCFCIFFGPTPMSRGNEIRPASAVEVFGKLEGNPKEFKKVSSGEMVSIDRAE
ncbi:MAG: cyclophilin-like fold protein [Armatimonadetes bacterium]|nr:cyclophilin-like fold protein [Armatimonadota bacterium]